jgi:hypothetical protein
MSQKKLLDQIFSPKERKKKLPYWIWGVLGFGFMGPQYKDTSI